MNQINEKTTGYVTVTFRDKAGVAVMPTSVSYRIDCMTTGQQVRNWTPIAPGPSVEIVLTPADTSILVDANTHEQRRITTVATYGPGNDDQCTDEVDFQVFNLKFVS